MRISDWSSDVCSSDLSLPSSCVGISISGFFRSKSNNGKLINARQTYSVAGRRNAAITLLPFPRPDQPCDQPSLSGKRRSEEHTSELQSLMRISYAVFCLKKKTISQETKNELTLIRGEPLSILNMSK